MNNNLNYYYDDEADIMYFSQGKPSKLARTMEAGDDVILRTHPKTGKVVGFTILNFIKRMGKAKSVPVPLPIQAVLTQSYAK